MEIEVPNPGKWERYRLTIEDGVVVLGEYFQGGEWIEGPTVTAIEEVEALNREWLAPYLAGEVTCGR